MILFCPYHAKLVPVIDGARICHACRRERGQEAQLERIANGKTRVPRDGGDALAVIP